MSQSKILKNGFTDLELLVTIAQKSIRILIGSVKHSTIVLIISGIVSFPTHFVMVQLYGLGRPEIENWSLISLRYILSFK